MERLTLNIKKSNYIIDGEQNSLFDLPQHITRLINSLEKEQYPASMEVEKKEVILQLSINKNKSQNLISELITQFNSIGIYLN